MDIFARTLGLVTEGESISLTASLTVQNGLLIDKANGARHLLEARTERSLRLLQNGQIKVGLWLKQAGGVGLSRAEAANVLRFLNDIAALEIRTHRGRLRIRRNYMRLRGISVLLPAIRLPGTNVGLAHALLLAITPVFMASAGVVVLAYAAGLLEESFIWGHMWFLLTVYLSTYGHEWVHLQLARRKLKQAYVIVRGTRIGVLHKRLPIKYEWRSAVYGPLVGSCIAGLFVGVLLVFDQRGYTVFSVLIVALFHWMSWLPLYGDGQTIKRLRKFRHATQT